MKLIKQLLVIAFVTITIASCNQKDAVTPAANQGNDGLLKTGPYCGDILYNLCDAQGNVVATVNIYASPNNVYFYFVTENRPINKISHIEGIFGGASFSKDWTEEEDQDEPASFLAKYISKSVYGFECGNNYTLSDFSATIVNKNTGVETTVTLCLGDEEYSLECCCWSDETAWAFGPRYNTRGNWATYVPYDEDDAPFTVDLKAGKKTKIGTVSFSTPSNGEVTITIDLGSRFSFADEGENVKIQDYTSAPSGNPAPGQFDWKFAGDYGDTNPFVVVVPQNNFYGVHIDALLSEVCED